MMTGDAEGRNGEMDAVRRRYSVTERGGDRGGVGKCITVRRGRDGKEGGLAGY